jgi:formiminoglutamase
MIKEFFQPFKPDSSQVCLEEGSLGNVLYKKSNPDNVEEGIVLFSVGNDFKGTRHALSHLMNHFPDTVFWDLGTFKEAATDQNTIAGLEEVLMQLREANCKVIILDAGKTSAIAQWKASKNMFSEVDFALISEGWNNSLMQTYVEILQNPKEAKHCFHLSSIATQAYNNNQKYAELLNNFFYERLGLGDFRANSLAAESLLRECHFASFDCSAIRSFGTSKNPNGLHPEEACILTRFAGISNALQSLSINHGVPTTEQEETLLAQMLWYFLDGAESKINDHPNANNKEFLLVRCPLENMPIEEVLFLKSHRSGRLWMGIGKQQPVRWLGCTDEDFEIAKKGEIPEKWFKSLNDSSLDN